MAQSYGRASMKITAIETLVCNARTRNWVFGKVTTDQPGLIGWGVDVNEAEIAKHPFEPEILQRVFYPDGSVGDW